jgi:hypothetical protein
MNKLTIEEVELFIKQNTHTFGAGKAVSLAKQLADTMRENEQLRDVLTTFLDEAEYFEGDMTFGGCYPEIITKVKHTLNRNKHLDHIVEANEMVRTKHPLDELTAESERLGLYDLKDNLLIKPSKT